MRNTLLSILAFGVSAFAQETFGGLRFGMSVAEVQKTYEGTLELSEVDGEQVLLDRNYQFLGLARIGLPATAHLGFDSSRQLSSVYIDTSIDPKPSQSALAKVTIQTLNRSLAERYGNPTTEKGTCELTSDVLYRGRSISCDRMWRVNGQIIEFSWSASPRTLGEPIGLTYLSLSYKLPRKGL